MTPKALVNDALSFDWDTPLSPDERDRMVAHLASNIKARGLETPLLWFLEIHKPLAPLGAQIGVALSPYISIWLKDGAFDLQKYTQLLRDPESIAMLIKLLDEPMQEVARPA